MKPGKKEFKIQAISPRGKIFEEKIQLILRPVKRKFSGFSPGVGVSYTIYEDSRLSENYTMISLTGKLSYVMGLTKNIDLGANTYFTIWPITRSSTETVRFVGANFRLGYRLSFLPKPWSLKLLAGFYYVTMFVSPANFGFQHMMGPQFFPVLSRRVGTSGAFYLYGKFSPVAGAFTILSLENNEIATGMGYFLDDSNLGITLDLAQLSLKISTVTIKSTSATLGAAFRF